MNVPQNNILDSFFDKLSPQNNKPKLATQNQNGSNDCVKAEQNIDFVNLAESAKEAEEEEQRRSRELANDDKRGDISLKKIYGIAILIILTLWVAFVVTFMMMQVCSQNIKPVSDTTLITLLTSATANILILPTVVLKYLFPNREKE